MGGRAKGLSPQADATALAAETLYRERKLSVAAIAQKLHVSKSTLYSYLRHRSVEIGPHKKPARAQPGPLTSAGEADPPKDRHDPADAAHRGQQQVRARQ